MADVSDFERDDDNDPIAQVLLPTGKTVALRWVDEDDDLTDDEKSLLKLADSALDGLSAEDLEAIEASVVTELTDSAFSQSDRDVEEEDYRRLAGDLELVAVTVFTDETVTLEFTAAKQYPDLTIYVQLDDEYEIEDLLVE